MTAGSRRSLGLVVTFVLGAALGCSSLIEGQPYPDRAFFVPEAPVLPAAAASGQVVLLAPVRVDAPFDGRALQYQVGPNRYEPDYYNQWADAPAALLTAAVRDALAETGRFAAIVDSASAARADLALELTVTELAVDTTDSAGPVAVLSIRARAVDPDGAVGAERHLEAREPAASASAADAVAAWSRALGTILAGVLELAD